MFRLWKNVDVSNENNLDEKDKAPVRPSTYLVLNLSLVHQKVVTKSSVESISLTAHRGRDACISLIESRMFWPNIYSDVCNFIKECNICQKVNPAVLKAVPKLQPVSVSTAVMKQIGIDTATLSGSEIKAVQNKTAETVATFLFKIICRHSCMSIQINDQGREFVNQVLDRLHVFTGKKQRVTSAYHPQSNGFFEGQNRTIKNMILKTLYNENCVSRWPDIIDGVLFTSIYSD
ncbi:Pro-Pol polyprotein [Aphis craccivora]|uniref:RNA-directed DNA polymerase n=1 Tax=Aphis craccivora TaxID=307492 RepID=A0A6G0Z8W7_APHCR|nr:Pro-Pol polyprotein [Aphis craccivora]